MTDYDAVLSPTPREQLRDLIKELAVVHGRVTLASGKEADYYVDMRRVTLDGVASPIVGRVMNELVADLDFDRAARRDEARAALGLRPDLPTLLCLLRATYSDCPQQHCVRRSPLAAWDKLPPRKSLFHQFYSSRHTLKLIRVMACIVRKQDFPRCHLHHCHLRRR